MRCLETLTRNEAHKPPYFLERVWGEGVVEHRCVCICIVVHNPSQAAKGHAQRAAGFLLGSGIMPGSPAVSSVLPDAVPLLEDQCQSAGGMAQLPGTGMGTFSPAAPWCQAAIQHVVWATASKQILIKYPIHGKWMKLNILLCHL